MITINVVTDNSVVEYAAEELRKYMLMMSCDADIEIVKDKSEGGFRLGLFSDLSINPVSVSDSLLDDALFAEVSECGGIIAGINPRSVLLSVYELLRRNGCRWLFPGKDGEYIPHGELKPTKFTIVPSSRFRGPCIEGACSQAHILETIDFLPKVGMNLFMSQFDLPTVFYKRYFQNSYSTARPHGDVEREQVAKWKAELESEIKLRGLQFHDMGHGWCVLPFGISRADIWSPDDPVTLPEENMKYMAMLGGKRCLNRGKPLITNICMSNTEARRITVQYIARYAEEHKGTDVLHVWLADSHNNHCECDACREKTPSDWYVILLNELDLELSARGLDTHVVFIAYSDTIFAPTNERIRNEGRFTLMIAPISRSYTHTLGDTLEPTPVYERNNITLPKTLGGYLSAFDGWRRTFGGSSVVYEYHFWRHQCMDLSGLDIAERIYDDLKCYKDQTFRGMIACGSQRSYFPTGFAYYVFARAQFDGSVSLEKLKREYFEAAFGEYAEVVLDYLEKIRRAFPKEYMNGEDCADIGVYLFYNPKVYQGLSEVKGYAKALKSALENASKSENNLTRLSSKLLIHHTDYATLVADFFMPLCMGDKETARTKYETMKAQMSEREDFLEPYFDHWLNIAYLERPIRTEDKYW